MVGKAPLVELKMKHRYTRFTTKLLSVVFGIVDWGRTRWGTKFLKMNRFVANLLYGNFWGRRWRISGQIFKIEDGELNMAETQYSNPLYWDILDSQNRSSDS